MKTVISKAPAETRALAGRIARRLPAHAVITLAGNLGAGKTEFVKGLARALGIRRPITSPTFLMVKSYPYVYRHKPGTLYHLDLYRLRSIRDTDNLPVAEALSEKNALIVVEWPEKIARALPKKRIRIRFKYGKEKNERHISYS